MNPREHSPTDKLIIGLDQALRTLFGRPQVTERSNPANDIDEAAMDEAQRDHVARLMRINHTGEVCAQALYQGQALTARDPQVRDSMQPRFQRQRIVVESGVHAAKARKNRRAMVAAVGIIIDVGRPWLIYRIPISVGKWNLDSALLEVALCVMAYVIVLWIEVSPTFLEKWSAAGKGAWASFSGGLAGVLHRILPWIIALGLVLPTMHQSSLGTVIMLAG